MSNIKTGELEVSFGLAWNSDGDCDYSYGDATDIAVEEAFQACSDGRSDTVYSAHVEFSLNVDDAVEEGQERVIKLWVDPESVEDTLVYDGTANCLQLRLVLAWDAGSRRPTIAIGRDEETASDNLREELRAKEAQDIPMLFAVLLIHVPRPPLSMQVVLR